MTQTQRQIPIALPSTGEDEWQAARDPIMTGWLTQGPKVGQFERTFARRHGVEHAIATTSCTTALHLILAALEIGPGDEVIVPSFTWVATANVVAYTGATPVLADIDPVSFNIDPADVANRITERTKAVIAVHLFGLCAEMDALRDVCGELPIIEDAACAAGAAYHNQPAGALGLAGAFSFHPRKTITTGEGGMVTTHSAGLAEQMNVLRNHGASVSEEIRHHGPKPYLLPDFNLLGFNYRMTDLQASVGLTQLAKLDRFVNERRAKAEWYGRELADLDWLITPDPPAHQVHSYQAYVCRVNPDRAPGPRNDLMEQLQQQGISTRPGTHAVHMLGYYQQRFGFKPDDLPASRDAAEQTLALPLHNRMTDEDYQYVVDALHQL